VFCYTTARWLQRVDVPTDRDSNLTACVGSRPRCFWTCRKTQRLKHSHSQSPSLRWAVRCRLVRLAVAVIEVRCQCVQDHPTPFGCCTTEFLHCRCHPGVRSGPKNCAWRKIHANHGSAHPGAGWPRCPSGLLPGAHHQWQSAGGGERTRSKPRLKANTKRFIKKMLY